MPFFETILTKIFGSKHEREVRRITPVVETINKYFDDYQSFTDDQLRAKTDEFKQRIADGEMLDELLPEAFAAVKDACRRLVGKQFDVVGIKNTWDMVPYDVQLIGGVVLHNGKIAEMATGEGKTLVATLPLYLNALEGKGCHLVTVNDYLALRDSQWMGEIFKFLGVTVGCIQHDMPPPVRREQYLCDITYGTNNEFGFDYLRDNMSVRTEDRVHRNFHYAIVDEVDSVLIDEARTPLIIAGPTGRSDMERYVEMRSLVERLMRRQTEITAQLVDEGVKLFEEEQEYDAGIKLLAVKRGAPKNKRFMKYLKETGVKRAIARVEADFTRDKRMPEIDEPLLFAIDEREHTIDLTDTGLNSLKPEEQALFELPDIGDGVAEIEERADLDEVARAKAKNELYKLHSERSEKVHIVSQLLKAYSLYEKDVEYVVNEGKVVIVDEFTGRMMPGRRYSEGLHQAIEAKERVRIEEETQTLATITLQNYFRLYAKLAGMTGTAVTEAAEFFDIYKLDVTSVPSHKPIRRLDYEDVIFRTRREKYAAIIDEIVEQHKDGRPVLVGTVSVEVSETLSRMLKRFNVPHAVLNAKYHQQEAAIVANAGQGGHVTIATNMAGRGTDIKLGPGVVRTSDDGDVTGGLHIIGTERHEARRIDRQLRGRAGRQGDPGSSRFFLSLEDDLMRLFGSERIASIMDRLGVQEGEVIEHRMVTRAIERAQKRVEAQNYSVRKHLLEYDNVMNQQRAVIYNRRAQCLEQESLRDEAIELIAIVCERMAAKHCPDSDTPEYWDTSALKLDLLKTVMVDLDFDSEGVRGLNYNGLVAKIIADALKIYEIKETAVTPEIMRQLERFAMLRVIDERWKEHLYEMDQLKTGIGLRAYGQRDPLIEYKKESFEMFTLLLDTIERETVEMIYRLQVAPPPGATAPADAGRLRAVHAEATAMGYRGTPEESRTAGKQQPVKRTEAKVGRNDPCPCGSGKKYKKCHGAAAAAPAGKT
ncbi:MAG TPA: preprotein translocase subunit SecA [candidate division Zixibacteria bacterium]|jgi:preprotein translocase subunit SecA